MLGILTILLLVYISLIYASRTVLLFGPSESGKNEAAKNLLGGNVEIIAFQRYQLNEQIQLVVSESCDDANLAPKFEASGLSSEKLDMVILLEDVVSERCRIQASQRALLRVLPGFEQSKILGLVTRLDEDDFDMASERLKVFAQRGIMALSFDRTKVLEKILGLTEAKAIPLGLSFDRMSYAELTDSLTGWKEEHVQSSNIQVAEQSFRFDGQGENLVLYTLEADQILMNPQKSLAARLFEGKLYVRQANSTGNLKIIADIAAHFSGTFGRVNVDSPLVELGYECRIETLKSGRVCDQANSDSIIGNLEAQELKVRGKFSVNTSIAPTLFKNSGSFRGSGLTCKTIENSGNVNCSGAITAYSIINGECAVMSAESVHVIGEDSSIDVSASVKLFSNEIFARQPEKVFLAFGSVGSGKDRLARIFLEDVISIDENHRLNDQILVHRFSKSDVVVINILSYDAIYWDTESSAITAFNGIKQVLNGFCRNQIDGVLLFESLLCDYSCTKRTIEQSKSVLKLFKSSLYPQSVLMIYTDVEEQNSRSWEEAKTHLADTGVGLICCLASALNAIRVLNAFNLPEIHKFSEFVIEAPLYQIATHLAVQGSKDSTSFCNYGYCRAGQLQAGTTTNRGVLVVDQELNVGNMANFGIVKSQTANISGVNVGSFFASKANVTKLLNRATVNCVILEAAGELINDGFLFSRRSTTQPQSIDNRGKLSIAKTLQVRSFQNTYELCAKHILAEKFINSGEAKVNILEVKEDLINHAHIKSNLITTRGFTSYASSEIEATTFSSDGCFINGQFRSRNAFFTGDVILNCPAVIKEMKCNGIVQFRNEQTRVESLVCEQSIGCSLVRYVVYETDDAEFHLPESLSPLRVHAKGKRSRLYLRGDLYIDELKTTHDTAVISQGSTTLDLSSDVFLASLDVEGSLIVKGDKSLYLGSIRTSPGSLIILESGDIIVSSRLRGGENGFCDIAGEIRCRDFLVEATGANITGSVRSTRNLDIFGKDVEIQGYVNACESWRIEGESVSLRSLPIGDGLLIADTLNIRERCQNHLGTLLVYNSYEGPAGMHLKYFEYCGQQLLSLDDARVEVLVLPKSPQLVLTGTGCFSEIQTPEATIIINGKYQAKFVEAANLGVHDNLTIEAEGAVNLSGSFHLYGILFADEAVLSAAWMSSCGACIAKSMLVENLGQFASTSYTSTYGLQSSETLDWSPAGVLDVGFLHLPAVRTFSPSFLYAAIILAPECVFVPQERGLISIMPDARHNESFMHCKEYRIPAIAWDSTQVSDMDHHRLFGCWPEEKPVSIRQTKFEAATTIRLADTFVYASSTHFPSDLSWEGTLKVKTGSDLLIDRFCEWKGCTLAVKAPNLTVRGLLTISGDLFLDIENMLLIERCQDQWIEQVVEKRSRRVLCFSSSSKRVRRICMTETDPRSGIINAGGEVAIDAKILGLKAGQVNARGNLSIKANTFNATANIDTSYEHDVAKGGNFFAGRKESYARLTGEIQAPMLVSGGEKTVEFGEMEVSGAQMLSRDDLTCHILGNAKLQPAMVWEEGRKRIRVSGLGVTKCSQERYMRVAPTTFGSTGGKAELAVGETLVSAGTNWIGTDIDIKARVANFIATYSESVRSTKWSGMADPLCYTEGKSREYIREAIPNTFQAASVSIRTEGDLATEAPIFDADQVTLTSEKGSVRISKALNEYERETDTLTASINFFGSDALRASARSGSGWAAKFLDEVPLLSALKAMTLAQSDQQLVCAGINTAIATVSTMRELSACGRLKDYVMGRLLRAELVLSETHEEQQVLQEIGIMMTRPGSSLAIEAKKDVCVEGLSGQLDSLFAKGAKVSFGPLKTESFFAADVASMGLSYNFGSKGLGVSVGAGESEGHSVAYQSPELKVGKLEVHAEEMLEVGTFIETLSTFIETKKLVIMSHRGTSTSSNWNASVNLPLPGKSKGQGGQNPLKGAGFSVGFGESHVETLDVAGIEAETMHVVASDDIELYGAVLRLTESAVPTPDEDGTEWFEFALPSSLQEALDGQEDALESEGEAALRALGNWVLSSGEPIQIWTEAGSIYVREVTITADSKAPTVNLLVKERDGGVSFSLLSRQPGVIEASYIHASDIESVHRESYIGVGVSDIMACASCVGYMSFDVHKRTSQSTDHVMLAEKIDTGSARMEGAFLARSEIDRVWTNISSNIHISIKSLPIITDFAEHFNFMQSVPEIPAELEDAIWKALEAELDDELLDGAEKSEQFNVQEITGSEEEDDQYVSAKLEESLGKANEELEGSIRAAEKEEKATEKEPVAMQGDGFYKEKDFKFHFDSEGDGIPAYTLEPVPTTEDSAYKKSVMGIIWLAEGSESTLRVLESTKSKYAFARLLMKATPAKIFVDTVGKYISKNLLRTATKETIVRAMSEGIFLTIADPGMSPEKRKELSERVHNASCLIYDWYALVASSKDLMTDLKAFGGDVRRFSKASWKAIKKSGAMNWLRKKLSKELLMKKSEAVMVTMLKRADTDLKQFKNNPTRFTNKYQKMLYQQIVGRTPMAETVFKGTKLLQKHGDKIGQAIDLINDP